MVFKNLVRRSRGRKGMSSSQVAFRKVAHVRGVFRRRGVVLSFGEGVGEVLRRQDAGARRDRLRREVRRRVVSGLAEREGVSRKEAEEKLSRVRKFLARRDKEVRSLERRRMRKFKLTDKQVAAILNDEYVMPGGTQPLLLRKKFGLLTDKELERSGVGRNQRKIQDFLGRDSRVDDVRSFNRMNVGIKKEFVPLRLRGTGLIRFTVRKRQVRVRKRRVRRR